MILFKDASSVKMGKDRVIPSLTWKKVLGPFPGSKEALPEGERAPQRGLWTEEMAERQSCEATCRPLGAQG